MSNETRKIKLIHSIPFQTSTGKEIQIDEIEFGRLKAKHLKLLPQNFFEGSDNGKANINPSDLLPLIAGLANLPQETVDEIDFEDLNTVCEAVASFLGKIESQATGKS